MNPSAKSTDIDGNRNILLLKARKYSSQNTQKIVF